MYIHETSVKQMVSDENGLYFRLLMSDKNGFNIRQMMHNSELHFTHFTHYGINKVQH